MHSYDDNARKMTPPQLAAVTAVGVSLLAFIIKFLLWRASGSVAIAAAAWHVAAGLLYALLMLGILHSPDEQPETELSEAEREYLQYQTGLQVNIKRHEAFLALFGSMGLLAVAYLIFSRVLKVTTSVPEQTTVSLLGLAVVFFAMQFLGRFTERIGLEHATPGLVATSFHARTDAFATLLAALALVTLAMGFQIERLFAALIGLLLVADAAQLFVDATRRIVGLEDDSPTAQLPFWVRLRDALRAYAQDMPPIVRWLLRYDDALSAEELRQARRWAFGVVGVVYLLTGFRTVELGEVGGVKYLGRYHGLAHPGPVYALWPFASVRVVPVDRIQRVTVGFTTASSWSPHQENRAFGEMLWQNDAVTNRLFKVDPEKSKFMLGDTTQVETHVALTYRVKHEAVGRYLFGIERPEMLVQLATQQAIQELMLTRGLDQVLVENRAALEATAEQRVQALLDAYQAGVQVEKCMIRSVHPPVKVLDSFADVASAIEDQQRDINEARGYVDRTLTTAKGEAVKLANQAQAEHARRVGEARGQTSEYRQISAAAATDAAAMKDRLAIESMERILTNRKKVILPRAAGHGRSSLWFGAAPGPGAGLAVPTPGGAAAPAGQPASEEGGQATEGQAAEGQAAPAQASGAAGQPASE